MAECSSSSSRPVKSILKRGSSEQRKTSQVDYPGEVGGIKWDEMNILMTEHPLDKDYGHMKIDEPKTPYSYDNDQGDDEDEQTGTSKVCPEALTDRVKEMAGQDRSGQKFFRSSTSQDDSDEELDPEQRTHKEEFKKWRKQHYNEFQNIRKARMLLAQEVDDEDDDDEAMDDKQSHVS